MSIPVLITERLKMRQLVIEDANEIFDIRSNEEVNQYLNREKTASLAKAKQFISRILEGIEHSKYYYWGITFAGKGHVIGTICLWNFSKDRKTAEVGYELAPFYHRKGLMKEALTEIVYFGFTVLKLESIKAVTHISNLPSRRLLENCDFTEDKITKLEEEGIVIYKRDNL